MGSAIEEYNVGLHRGCGGQVNRHGGDWGGYFSWYQCGDCEKEVDENNITSHQESAIRAWASTRKFMLLCDPISQSSTRLIKGRAETAPHALHTGG